MNPCTILFIISLTISGALSGGSSEESTSTAPPPSTSKSCKAEEDAYTAALDALRDAYLHRNSLMTAKENEESMRNQHAEAALNSMTQDEKDYHNFKAQEHQTNVKALEGQINEAQKKIQELTNAVVTANYNLEYCLNS